jgi:dUTP pyrophosphatase
MQVRVSRIDKTLPLPQYETAGAVAFDLITRETTIVPVGQVAFVPVNIIICIPEGHVLLLSSRSSTARKKGLVVPLGIIDPDYCGPKDELKLQVINFTKTDVTVERGERVGQALLIPISRAEWQETDTLDGPNRGGFGTTGGYAG